MQPSRNECLNIRVSLSRYVRTILTAAEFSKPPAETGFSQSALYVLYVQNIHRRKGSMEKF